MNGLIPAVLISLLLLQLLLWILITIDTRRFAGDNTTAGKNPVERVPEITIMIPFFGLVIQLWYLYSRVAILSDKGK
ncbi:hypothetical protein K0C01_10500 [Salinarchaeum sp. IM2453]|uniref:hypothetical protein n=1 Tax=Salinarchaeum sp. IM2453 TaxID=2862870 RepID=UPI001C838687|nr:hypothetical protein [Salinarchaeum sp. IM2453]QZA88207.1 hypothetical protein K0C01_10500 [Salinarchaeum sp. IM2453]